MKRSCGVLAALAGCGAMLITSGRALAAPSCTGGTNEANSCLAYIEDTSGDFAFSAYSTAGAGLYADDSSSGQGVFAVSYSGIGVLGVSGYTTFSPPSGTFAGYFESPGNSGAGSNAALYANATGSGGTGILGTGYGYGVYGSSSAGYGVYGESTSSSAAVFGTASSSDGVAGTTSYSSGSGVQGTNTSSGSGVNGYSADGIGVQGTSGGGGDGVHGESSGEYWSGVSGVNDGTGGHGVYGEAASGLGVIGQSNTGYAVYGNCIDGGCVAGYFSGPVTVTGELTVGSCSGCTSDARLKKNVQPLKGALERLLALRGVTYEWIDPEAHDHEAGHGLGTQTGFIAQDVQKVFPNWVKEEGYTAKDGEKYKTLELRQIEALEVESIRELKVENDELRTRLAALEDNRRPMMSGANGVGLGLGAIGIAIGAAMSIRKRRS